MLEHRVGQFPVVSRENWNELTRYFGTHSRSSKARKRFMHEEYVRQRGWLKAGIGGKNPK